MHDHRQKLLLLAVGSNVFLFGSSRYSGGQGGTGASRKSPCFLQKKNGPALACGSAPRYRILVGLRYRLRDWRSNSISARANTVSRSTPRGSGSWGRRYQRRHASCCWQTDFTSVPTGCDLAVNWNHARPHGLAIKTWFCLRRSRFLTPPQKAGSRSD